MTRRIATLSQLVQRALRYRPQYKLRYPSRPKTCYYLAEGGPYDGKRLALVDGDTAPLRVGNQRGRYLCGLVAGRSSDCHGTTVWKPAP